MSKMIFVNLPVRDLIKARKFYEAICTVNNPQFSDENSACMVFSESINVMLMTHAKWATFTKKPIADANKASETDHARSCNRRRRSQRSRVLKPKPAATSVAEAARAASIDRRP